MDPLIPGRPEAPTEALSRLYEVATFSWTTGMTPGILGSVAFPDALFTIPFLLNIVKGFVLFRAGIEIEIRINGNKFLYGKLMASWDPATAMDATAPSEVSIWSASTGPHVLIDADAPEVHKIELPYVWPVPSLDLRAYPSGSLGTLDLYVFAPLTNVSSASGTISVPISVYARFVDPVLDGATDSALSAGDATHVRALKPLDKSAGYV